MISTKPERTGVQGIHVLVFKTDISSGENAVSVARILAALPAVLQCNVDLDDIDRVLRIVSTGDCTEEIITLVRKQGFLCEEL